MSCVDFHDLRIAWRCEGVDETPVRSLLGAFDAATGEPHISIDLGRARAPADLSGFRQTFKHGVRGFERSGEFLLTESDAHVRISADGRSIDAHLAAGMDVETTLFIALAIALRQHGLFHMHAGALVRAAGQSLLVLGNSGAGKSTVTLSLLDSDGCFLGDDAVFLAERSGNVRVLGFPRPFHLGEAIRAAFRSLPAGTPIGSGKRAIPLEALPGRLALAMDAPSLLLFPQVEDAAKTELIPLTPADAFGRALHSSAFAAVDGMANVPAQLALLRRLVDGARGYELRLGADGLKDRGRMGTLIEALG